MYAHLRVRDELSRSAVTDTPDPATKRLLATGSSASSPLTGARPGGGVDPDLCHVRIVRDLHQTLHPHDTASTGCVWSDSGGCMRQKRSKKRTSPADSGSVPRGIREESGE